MAEDKNTEESNNSVKRRLKTNTETVRERSAKHQLKAAEPPKPNLFSSFWFGFTWPLRKLFGYIAKLNRFRVFRVIGRILYPTYFRTSVKELKLVTWPNRRTSWRLTYAVIVFSVIFGIIVAIVDFVLDKLFKELIIK